MALKDIQPNDNNCCCFLLFNIFISLKAVNFNSSVVTLITIVIVVIVAVIILILLIISRTTEICYEYYKTESFDHFRGIPKHLSSFG